MTTTMDHSGNPALGDRFEAAYRGAAAPAAMTVFGTALRTAFLLVILVAGGAWGWASATGSSGSDLGGGYANTTVTIPGGFWLASLGALFVGLWLVMNPMRAAVPAMVYALLEGYVLGAISAMFDAQTEGIVGAAVVATLSVFLAALFLYVTRLVRPTQRMAFAVAAGIGGLLLLYLFVFVVSIFNWSWLYTEEFRTIGIVVNLIAVVLAALSFTLDFASIEAGVKAGAPKRLEWYGAYGLLVTMVWLYVTMLRLLALLARNR